jgi:hypothetical protein
MMTPSRPDAAEPRASVPALIRDAADSFVELIAAHIKLTNLELVADLEARTRRLAYQLVICVAALVGYGLLMVGLAFAVAPVVGRPWAFSLLGALHLIAAGITAVVLARRHQPPSQIQEALESMGKSMTLVSDAVLAPDYPHARN